MHRRINTFQLLEMNVFEMMCFQLFYSVFCFRLLFDTKLKYAKIMNIPMSKLQNIKLFNVH